MLRLAKLSANKCNLGVRHAATQINEVFSENQLDVNTEDNTVIQESPATNNVNTPTNTLLNIINRTKRKGNPCGYMEKIAYLSLCRISSPIISET